MTDQPMINWIDGPEHESDIKPGSDWIISKDSMSSNIQKEFDDWFYDFYGSFSLRCEHFDTDCEIENVETRRQLLFSWVKSAFEVGYESGYDQGCFEATGGQ